MPDKAVTADHAITIETGICVQSKALECFTKPNSSARDMLTAQTILLIRIFSFPIQASLYEWMNESNIWDMNDEKLQRWEKENNESVVAKRRELHSYTTAFLL